MSQDIRYAVHPDDYVKYDNRKIRERFLVKNIFNANEVTLTYSHYERLIVGGVMPIENTVVLETVDELKADFFLARRELGAINVGGTGVVIVDGQRYELGHREAIYIGMGCKNVSFASEDASAPAKFYLNSAPAHAAYPVKKVGIEDADSMHMGSKENCNERIINKLLVDTVIQTCQLQMGLTEFKPGSCWNTMPAHTHSRRMEAYFYFDIPEGQSVCHFMGPREETRHIWMENDQAALSPPWSIHSGVGTSSYTFIWGMAGENLDYSDMDTITPDQFAKGHEE